MGFLTKKNRNGLNRLPSGTFTVDSRGEVVSSTVPQAVPAALVREVGQQVAAIFEGARKAQSGFSELVLHYAAFKITAREMRGGAIIFLSPKALQPAGRP